MQIISTAPTAYRFPGFALLSGVLSFFADKSINVPDVEIHEAIANLKEKSICDGKHIFVFNCHEETHSFPVTQDQYEKCPIGKVITVRYRYSNGFRCRIESIDVA